MTPESAVQYTCVQQQTFQMSFAEASRKATLENSLILLHMQKVCVGPPPCTGSNAVSTHITRDGHIVYVAAWLAAVDKQACAVVSSTVLEYVVHDCVFVCKTKQAIECLQRAARTTSMFTYQQCCNNMAELTTSTMARTKVARKTASMQNVVELPVDTHHFQSQTGCAGANTMVHDQLADFCLCQMRFRLELVRELMDCCQLPR